MTSSRWHKHAGIRRLEVTAGKVARSLAGELSTGGRKQRPKHLDIDGLCEVPIEPRLRGARLVFMLPQAGQRHEHE
jgi:hypothetical protein